MGARSSPEHACCRGGGADAAGQGPSPPLAVHERGSQGWSDSTVGVGAWKAPEFPELPLLGLVVVVVDVTPAPPGEVVEVAAGALTEKSVPVTTVTCDPGFTWDGSRDMMTAPESESATAWAAARLAGVLEA